MFFLQCLSAHQINAHPLAEETFDNYGNSWEKQFWGEFIFQSRKVSSESNNEMFLNEKKKEEGFQEASDQIGRQKNVLETLEVDRIKETPVTHKRQTES